MQIDVILGPAGSGKTTLLRERARENPNYARVTATTGIAAVNLGPGVTTMNSALGFYNEESALDALETGKLAKRWINVARQGYENLVIDEISMMTDRVLEYIVEGAKRAEEQIEYRNAQGSAPLTPCGLILTGDFLQLPPVRGEFCFNARVWPEVEITKLTQIHRQADPAFLEALQAARAGQGVTTVAKLQKAGVVFTANRNDFFEGTTLMPTNAMADCMNRERFATLVTEIVGYKSARWGDEQGEWREIPDVLDLREGATVMVLANEPVGFSYVNGDTGKVVSFNEQSVMVEITRGDGSVSVQEIPYVLRETMQKHKPENVAEYCGFLIDGAMVKSVDELKAWKQERMELIDADDLEDIRSEMIDREYRRRVAKFMDAYDGYVSECVEKGLPYFLPNKNRWVTGWISYMPLRLSWACTIHKSQGLTMTHVQIDARNRFGGNPGMMYVALSRCRTPQGIRIVASPADFARRVKTAVEVLKWV